MTKFNSNWGAVVYVMIGALDGSLLARLAQGDSDSDADE
jgi:hypothetical protein